MDDQTLTPMADFVLPWGKQLRVSELTYESGLTMLRLRFREGKHRFTDIDVDAGNAARLVDLFGQWLASQASQASQGPAEGEDDGQ